MNRLMLQALAHLNIFTLLADGAHLSFLQASVDFGHDNDLP